MTPPNTRLDTFGRGPSFEGAEPQAAREAASWATRAVQPLAEAVTFVLRLLDVAILAAIAVDLSGEQFGGLIGGIVWLGHALSRTFSAGLAPVVGHGHLLVGGLVMLGLLIAADVAIHWAARKVKFAPSKGVTPRGR